MITISTHPLESVEARLSQVLQGEGMVNEVLSHVQKAKGKRLRPLLVLLTFELCDGVDYEEAINVASGVELVHMASLIHDDIIDSGQLRRGQETVYRKFGTQIAVLAGDQLFAQAFHLFSLGNSGEVLTKMTQTIQEMCIGEINQLLTPLTSEKDYWLYIEQKTGSLISSSCELGAILAHKTEFRKILHDFGLYLGLAFQLTDDVLDYGGTANKLGKKIGTDFSEGLWTLPTLRGFQRGILGKNWANEDFDTIRLELDRKGVLMEVWQEASNYAEKAKQLLEHLPTNRSKYDLEQLCNKIIKRDY